MAGVTCHGFDTWMRALETRHLADLQFREVTRALRALSSTYVERRGKLSSGAALSGNGKRAAFALFYGPLHYLLVRAIAERIPDAPGMSRASWSISDAAPARPARDGPVRVPKHPTLFGVDRHPWAVAEAAAGYRELGVSGRTEWATLARDSLPKGQAYLAAFTLNELSTTTGRRSRSGCSSAARRAAPCCWWNPSPSLRRPGGPPPIAPFLDAGGHADEWRISADAAGDGRETGPRRRPEPPSRSPAVRCGLMLRCLRGATIDETSDSGAAAGPGRLSAPSLAAPATMRVDYYHTGNDKTEHFSVDQIVVEPLPWAGNVAKAIDTTNPGKYFFEVADAESGAVLYSRGFASIYGEWETTGEARVDESHLFGVAALSGGGQEGAHHDPQA